MDVFACPSCIARRISLSPKTIDLSVCGHGITDDGVFISFFAGFAKATHTERVKEITSDCWRVITKHTQSERESQGLHTTTRSNKVLVSTSNKARVCVCVRQRSNQATLD